MVEQLRTQIVPATGAFEVGHSALLATAYGALAAAASLPDVTHLIDRAEVIRVAAHAAGLSTEGQNAWLRYKIDCQRAAAEQIEAMRAAGELTEQGQRSDETRLPSLGSLGVEARRAHEWAKLAAVPLPELDAAFDKATRAGKLLAESALVKLGAAIQTTQRRRAASRNAAPLPDGMELRIGDAREVLADVATDSVALVLTDPPYGDAAEPLYGWLAAWAARVLVPGGSLICYTGQSRLDRDMRLLGAQLRYWWLLALLHDQAQRLPGKFVIAEFKPVLWFVKHYRRGRALVPDLLSSERDKSLHPWSQGTGGASALIEHLSEPGELIADPFAGTARWGHVAAQMGRRWVGADIVAGGDVRVDVDVDVEAAS